MFGDDRRRVVHHDRPGDVQRARVLVDGQDRRPVHRQVAGAADDQRQARPGVELEVAGLDHQVAGAGNGGAHKHELADARLGHVGVERQRLFGVNVPKASCSV